MSTRPDQVKKPTTQDIDRISLHQALLDAELSLNRAHDLMSRLVEVREQLADERARNIELQMELAELKKEHEAVTSNRAYRLAWKIWSIRETLGV